MQRAAPLFRAGRRAQIIAPLLRVLEKSHAQHIMHRDIKVRCGSGGPYAPAQPPCAASPAFLCARHRSSVPPLPSHAWRPLQPENIFLTKGNRLRLGDFGLAVNWTEELPFSRSGTLVRRGAQTRLLAPRRAPAGALRPLTGLRAQRVRATFAPAQDYMAPEVLRNPASTMQESPHVQMAGLDQRSIQPYDEKASPTTNPGALKCI